MLCDSTRNSNSFVWCNTVVYCDFVLEILGFSSLDIFSEINNHKALKHFFYVYISTENYIIRFRHRWTILYGCIALSQGTNTKYYKNTNAIIINSIYYYAMCLIAYLHIYYVLVISDNAYLVDFLHVDILKSVFFRSRVRNYNY